MKHAFRAVVAAAVLTSVLVLAAPGPAAAATSRVAGDDRFATAASLSRSRFSPGVPVAFVVTGRRSPDALAAGPAASHRGGPVLLVEQGSVPAATRTELDRLNPAAIVVSGGANAVSDAVLDDLRQYAPVSRVAGADRYDTAARVSAASFTSASTVFVANGSAVADALAGAPAAHKAGAPLLLVTAGGVPSSTAAEIRRLGATRAVILGGSGAVGSGAESQLRALVGSVSRIAGNDRYLTSATISSQTFSAGVGAAYVASGLNYADALAGGPVAALAPGPILLAATNCMPAGVIFELGRLRPANVVLLGGSAVLGRGVEDRSQCPGPGVRSSRPSVGQAAGPAWDDAGPDPSLLRVGSTWYVYTTGTRWGNNIGVLRSTRPDAGWATTTGREFGSTALGAIPAWQVPGTQWAPGVMEWRGRYVMFFAAQMRANGKWCVSSAVSTSGPTGPFHDTSGGPIACQLDLGGSIDPHPFVDANGTPWLYWKNNDGSTADVSRVWAAPLRTSDAKALAGTPREVLAKDTRVAHWQTTVDNPQMVLKGGVYYLFHTGGDWQGESYTVGYAVCAGPLGPCTTNNQPILQTYGDVVGPGGGTVEIGTDGRWWMSYHAWTRGCTNDACGGVRKLYVAPLTWR